MPSDLRRPAPRASLPRSHLRVFLICFVGALYALAAIRFDLPPYSWSQAAVRRWNGQEQKVVRQRPALRNVERYSPQHRFRPAASPIVTEVAKDGKVKLRGQYT
ncbi:hypothetical protein JCM8547_006679 [Rhodosporidiobolus lusitaniae]